MYARNLGGKKLTFDFGKGLVQDNLVIVDRETRSVWSQLAGKAVSGPMEHTPLEALPSMQTTWEHWKERHPDTRVVVGRGLMDRDYTYRGKDGRRSGGHDTSNVGLGVAVEGEAWYFPFEELDRLDPDRLPLRHDIGGRTVTIHWRPEGLTAWAEDESGDRIVAVVVYEDGWRRFFPETKTYEAPE